MKNRVKILDFLATKRCVIPLYQRNYDWNKNHCKRLYDDLVNLLSSDRRNHFFGIIVYHFLTDVGNTSEYVIIDGQQRITTVSLLLLAMRNFIDSMDLPDGNMIKRLSNNIDKYLILDDYMITEENKRIRLKLVKDDMLAFNKLFNSREEHIPDSNLTINYNYFYERISKQEISIDNLFNAIHKLEIMEFLLEQDDDPQLIFETLNSTGKDLEEGDKIRNFILMNLKPEQQDRYYNNYWHPIEKFTNYDVSAFVRDYLSIKLQSTPSEKNVYICFKDFCSKFANIEKVLDELLAYSKRYSYLLNGGHVCEKLNACIFRLNRLGTSVARPFLLDVLALSDEGKLTIDELLDIFITVESYVFRRLICELPSNCLNKIFVALHREIIRYDGSENQYLDKFRYTLLSKEGNARFPTDNEFETQFTNRPVYASMSRKNLVYILERLANYATRETCDVYKRVDDKTYSIEHIMPQTLSQDWKQDLGGNYAVTHKIWLHRIANLTLTAYNQKYSNCRFIDKKTMQNGFNDSGIRLNNYIAQKEKWTNEELNDRNEHLKNLALNIWKYPQTNFMPENIQCTSCTLDDDLDLTQRKLKNFEYKGNEYDTNQWVDMYYEVLNILYHEDPSILLNLATSNDERGFSNAFTISADRYTNSRRSFKKIGDIYVLTNIDTKTKISNLKKIFSLYGIDASELVFYLKK